MDILGLPKLQNVERKIEDKTQSSSISLRKNSEASKTSPNGFSSQLEKTLEKKSEKDIQPKDAQQKADQVRVQSNASEKPIAKKQEYSRNTKINPPKEEDTKESTRAVSGQEQDLSWIVNAQMPTVLPAQMASAPQNADATEGISDSKLLNPKLEQKVSPEVLPILKFLKAMSENFKIAPEKIMQALQELPENALMQKPQAAVTHLLQKLEIQPRQFTKAQILFNQMVTDIESVEKNKAGLKAQDPSLSTTFEFSDIKTDGKVDNLKEIKNLTQELQPQPAQIQRMMAGQAKAQTTVTPADISQLRTQNVIQPESSTSSRESLDALLKNMNVSEAEVPLQPKMKAVDMDTFVNQLAMERNKILDQASEFDLAEGEDDMASEFLNQDILGQLSEAPVDKSTNIQKLVENIVNAANPEVKAQNMQKITEQAQVLIQKGGGEMKVQLSPEGMGDVLLKVKVQDGQVGIQMTTDNHQAKKLIESSVADLKVNLAEHKLNLDTIKVDVAEKMQDQFNNQNSDFRREDAREFLSQFRQNNDGFRQSMFSSPGNRSYQKTSQSQTPDIKPLENTGRNNNGRIHLVA